MKIKQQIINAPNERNPQRKLMKIIITTAFPLKHPIILFPTKKKIRIKNGRSEEKPYNGISVYSIFKPMKKTNRSKENE